MIIFLTYFIFVQVSFVGEPGLDMGGLTKVMMMMMMIMIMMIMMT